MLLILILFFSVFVVACEKRDECIPEDTMEQGADVQLSGILNYIAYIATGQLLGMNKYGDYNLDNSIIRKIFMAFLTDVRYLSAFYLSIVLYIAVVGFQYTVGLKEFKIAEIFTIFSRVFVVFLFLTPEGWDNYKNLVAEPFLTATNHVTKLISESFLGTKVNHPLDIISYGTTSYLLNLKTWIKIVALIFSGWWGVIYAIVILWSFVYLLIATLKAFITYISTLILAGILLVIGPITFIFSIFDKTRQIFTSWLRELLGLLFQQYSLFIAIFLMSVISGTFLRNITYYGVCFSSIMDLKIKIPFPPLIRALINGILDVVGALVSFDLEMPEYLIELTFPLVFFYKIVMSALEIPIDISGVFALILISLVFQDVMDKITTFSNSISGAKMEANSTSGLGSMMNKLNSWTSKVDDMAIKASKGVAARMVRTQIRLLTAPYSLAKAAITRNDNKNKKKGIGESLKNIASSIASFISGGESKANQESRKALDAKRAFHHNRKTYEQAYEKEFAKKFEETNNYDAAHAAAHNAGTSALRTQGRSNNNKYASTGLNQQELDGFIKSYDNQDMRTKFETISQKKLSPTLARALRKVQEDLKKEGIDANVGNTTNIGSLKRHIELMKKNKKSKNQPVEPPKDPAPKPTSALQQNPDNSQNPDPSSGGDSSSEQGDSSKSESSQNTTKNRRRFGLRRRRRRGRSLGRGDLQAKQNPSAINPPESDSGSDLDESFEFPFQNADIESESNNSKSKKSQSNTSLPPLKLRGNFSMLNRNTKDKLAKELFKPKEQDDSVYQEIIPEEIKSDPIDQEDNSSGGMPSNFESQPASSVETVEAPESVRINPPTNRTPSPNRARNNIPQRTLRNNRSIRSNSPKPFMTGKYHAPTQNSFLGGGSSDNSPRSRSNRGSSSNSPRPFMTGRYHAPTQNSFLGGGSSDNSPRSKRNDPKNKPWKP